MWRKVWQLFVRVLRWELEHARRWLAGLLKR
jgi:hypothetical protein